MEEEQSAKIVKSASKLKYPVPDSWKEQSIWDSKLKMEVDIAMKQAKDINMSL